MAKEKTKSRILAERGRQRSEVISQRVEAPKTSSDQISHDRFSRNRQIQEKQDLLISLLTLARNIFNNFDLDLDFEIGIDFISAIDLARNLALELVRDIELNLDSDLDNPLVCDLALDLHRLCDRTRILDYLKRNRDFGDALALDFARDRAFVRDRALALDRTLDRDRRNTKSNLISRLLIKSIILVLEIIDLAVQGSTPVLRLTLTDSRPATGGFSPHYLTATVMPYLDALIQIQHVIDEIHERQPADIKILNIQYGSITVDITGGIRDSVELILDNVVKWRRENKKKLAEYETLQKQVEIEQAKVTIAAEAEQAPEQARLLRAQAHSQELENQKTQLEIMKLTLEMVAQIKPDLPDEQRLLYAMKMVDPTRVIATSPLELISAEPIEPTPPAPTPDETTPAESEPDD